MEKLAVLLTREPYGEINGAEAVRHALGAVSEGLDVALVLAEGGVRLAEGGQDVGGTGFTNLGDSLSDCVDMGVGVYADRESLEKAGLGAEDLVPGVQAVEGGRASAIIGGADCVIIY